MERLRPSFLGIVSTERDINTVFYLALSGMCPMVRRRFNPRTDLIEPGTVYVYHEVESGIIRWTDGLVWSDSYHHGVPPGSMLYKQAVHGNRKMKMHNGLRRLSARYFGDRQLHLVAYYRDDDTPTDIEYLASPSKSPPSPLELVACLGLIELSLSECLGPTRVDILPSTSLSK
jgi:hypothetical protein